MSTLDPASSLTTPTPAAAAAAATDAAAIVNDDGSISITLPTSVLAASSVDIANGRVTVDGVTYIADARIRLIDPYATRGGVDVSLWNTATEPEDNGMVYEMSSGEAVTIFDEDEHMLLWHESKEMLAIRGTPHAYQAAMDGKRSHMYARDDGTRHELMSRDDAIARYWRPDTMITPNVVIPHDWNAVVYQCAQRIMNIAPSLTPVPVPLLLVSSTSDGEPVLIYPRELQLLIASYCVPLVHIGRVYERRLCWPSSFYGYQQSMIYERHPYAIFKVWANDDIQLTIPCACGH